MNKIVLTFLENQPFWSFITLIASIWLIVKISRAGFLRQYELHLILYGELSPSLLISWTGPINHRSELGINTHRAEVFRKSLVAAKYGTGQFNFKAFAEMMALSGYTNISIEELDKKKEQSPPADQPK